MSDMYPDCDIVGPDTMRLQWSEEDPVTVFWREDEECSHYQTRFLARHSLPARALVSYPGSGNTWTRYTCTRVQQLYTCTLNCSLYRYLLEAATGVFTGSVYYGEGIYEAGHLGEARDYNDGSTLIQKTHHNAVGPQRSLSWRIEHIEQFGGQGVLVIRNPYKAFISYWNLLKTGSQTETAASESLQGEEFRSFVISQANKWLELIRDWLEISTSRHVIFYEVSELIVTSNI